MPRYDYEDLATGEIVEVVHPYPPPETLTQDGREMKYRFDLTAAAIQTVPSGWQPIALIQQSVLPSQVAEARRLNPNDTYDDKGTLWANSPNDMKRIARERGLEDHNGSDHEKTVITRS